MREWAHASGSSAAVHRSSALGSMRGLKFACNRDLLLVVPNYIFGNLNSLKRKST